jgi:hypothetical protein
MIIFLLAISFKSNCVPYLLVPHNYLVGTVGNSIQLVVDVSVPFRSEKSLLFFKQLQLGGGICTD